VHYRYRTTCRGLTPSTGHAVIRVCLEESQIVELCERDRHYIVQRWPEFRSGRCETIGGSRRPLPYEIRASPYRRTEIYQAYRCPGKCQTGMPPTGYGRISKRNSKQMNLRAKEPARPKTTRQCNGQGRRCAPKHSSHADEVRTVEKSHIHCQDTMRSQPDLASTANSSTTLPTSN